LSIVFSSKYFLITKRSSRLDQTLKIVLLSIVLSKLHPIPQQMLPAIDIDNLSGAGIDL